MATHGKAREATIAALRAREPFRRSGFGMSAVTGPADTLGQLPDPYRAQYRAAESAGKVAYTVLSYQTPILWVLTDGMVVRPPIKYSRTTTAHQSLARYVRREVPADFPVRVLAPGDGAEERATCGTCGRSWDDAISTGRTPVPSGRCPFEYFHEEVA